MVALPLRLRELGQRGGSELELHIKLRRPVLRGLETQTRNKRRPVVATGRSADSWILLKSAFSPNRRINGVLGS